MRKALPWIVVAVLVVGGLTAATLLRPLVLVGASKALDMFIPLSDAPAPIGSADLSGSGPGTLLSATTMPGVTSTFNGQGIRAARVVYHSTSGDTSAQTVVSGTVLTPLGQAPKGGWPVVALLRFLLLAGRCRREIPSRLARLARWKGLKMARLLGFQARDRP